MTLFVSFHSYVPWSYKSWKYLLPKCRLTSSGSLCISVPVAGTADSDQAIVHAVPGNNAQPRH